MALTSSRVKPRESAISICILIALFIIAAAMFLKQSDYQMAKFGIDATAITELQNSKLDAPFDLNSFMPAGFENLSQIQTYDSENLFEKINGKAPLYTESGFKKLYTQRFVSKDNETLIMEFYLYDMVELRNAFSVYSTQKRPDTQDLSGFDFAYKTDNAIYFAHGQYYIELVGFSQSSRLLEAMNDVSRNIQTNLTIDDTKMPQLEFFPTENLIPGSVKLYLTGAFGYEGLTDIFTAQYEVDGQTVTAFLSELPNSQDAQKSAKNYYDFLINNGGVAKQTTVETLKGKIIDFYDTTEIVFATGTFLAGIHEADNQRTAEKLTIKLFDRLNELDKSK